MDNLRPPLLFSFEGNLSYPWKIWEKHFNFFLTDSKSDKVKTSILFTCIGSEGREIYETFSFPQGDKLKPVLEKFTGYCNSCKNITILCHQLVYLQATGRTVI